MNCCHCEGIENQFDREKAAKKIVKYHKKGPQKTTQVLTQALIEAGVQDASLLDIGGGIGLIQHILLKAGAAQATNLEASTGYLEACQQVAEQQGHADRITHIHGDFADMQNAPAADIVTMERVICCYPDYEQLLNQACSKSKQLLGIVYPIDSWLVKLVMALFFNLPLALKKNDFRVFAHPTEEIEAIIAGHGFERKFYQLAGSWQVVVYGRAS